MGSFLGTVETVDVGRPDPSLTNRLRRLPLEQLFEMGDMVEGLVEHPGWEPLLSLLDAEIAEIDERLDGQSVPLSRAEYAMAHGRRRGLRMARDAAMAVQRVYHEKLEEQRRKHEDGDGSS